MNEFVLGIDIGGTNLRMGTVTRSGELSFFEKMPSPPIITENAVANLVSTVQTYLLKNTLKGCISAICIGVPSSVSKDKSFLYSSPNLLGLQNMDLGKEMTAALGIRTFIDRDVNYLLAYDIAKLELDPAQNKTILGFYIGTGLGNAVYLNGRLHSGKNGVAGELGHIPLYHENGVCGCGKRGCCETLCSGYHLADLVDTHFPDCEISAIFTKHSSDPLLVDFVDTLALPLATEITLLDPDCVVLGGGVLQMADFPLEQLLTAIRGYTRSPYPAGNLTFFFAEHSQACGVIGGAYTVFPLLDASAQENG
ncbi:MAG: allose kinase [Pygmaiobacter sp.]